MTWNESTMTIEAYALEINTDIVTIRFLQQQNKENKDTSISISLLVCLWIYELYTLSLLLIYKEGKQQE